MPYSTDSKYGDQVISVQPMGLRDGSSHHLRAIPSVGSIPDHRSTASSANRHDFELYDITNDKRGLVTPSSTAQSLKPAPTKDPRDPLNLSKSRKMIACLFVCFFGAMAAAAELILGAMLPVFSLQYANIDPKTIVSYANINLAPGTNPLALVAALPGAPPVWKVYLLGSLPVLIIGVSNLIMVPMATAIGRRPVILSCGIIAIVGAIWAGFSQSLDSHLLARCVQAVGAGTVESLIPFVVADLTFDHQRNTWMSYVFATQGLIIVGLGFATPYIIIYLSWRWLYFITAMGAALFLIGVFLFLPETRWKRTHEEMRKFNNTSLCYATDECFTEGIPKDESLVTYMPRTWKYDLALIHGRPNMRYGLAVLTDALATLFYPQILIITMLNGAMISSTFAAGYTVAPPLIVKPWGWPFFNLTLCLIPILIASFGTLLITGRIADVVSNWSARRRPGGRRAAEDQLLNLILPTISGLLGSILYGVAGGDPSSHSWVMYLAGLGLMAFGFLGANTVGTVYVLECYPDMGGSALLSIASIRYIIAFFLSFRVSELIVDIGYAKTFLIYTCIIAFCAAMLPVLWWFGPAWKTKFPGRRTAV